MRGNKDLKPRPMVKAAITAAGYRHRDFGALVGLNEQAVSGVVTGRRKVSRSEMARIAQILNTPMRLLFPEEFGEA